MTPIHSPEVLQGAVVAVLQQFGAVVEGLRWAPLGTGGGFSGARVWRGDDESGKPIFVLKAWPDGMPPERLANVHQLMARAAELPFVPTVARTPDGRTAVAEAGLLWDVSRWLPGEPERSEKPPVARVTAACATVAELHAVWRTSSSQGPCPGIRNRIQMLLEAPRLLHAITQVAVPIPELIPLLRRAAAAVQWRAPAAEQALRPWAMWTVTIQPCVRDLRADHVLFTDNAVTGIIDYGAAADDHPGTDLARLLGDYAGEDHPDLYEAGLEAYWAAGGELGVPNDFVRLLDRTGLVCSVLAWIHRLFSPQAKSFDPAAVAARLERLVHRLELLPPF